MILLKGIRSILLCSFIAGLLAGCSSTGGSASVSAYYGVGWYDPWYYGRPYYGDDIIIVNPPPRPEHPDRPTRPEKPIKPLPPVKPLPSPRPMPSIPTRLRQSPRPMLRR